VDTREGSSRGKFCPRSHSPLSLTLATPNPQPASSHRPGDAPGPHLQAPHRPYLTVSSPSRQCRPGRARWRPVLRQHASARSRASGRSDTPPPSPNPQQPTTLPVGHPLARALTAPRTHHGGRERALRSRSCTHAFLPSRAQACKASKPRRHATLTLHGRALALPSCDTNLVHVN
jgi:hypothetical protein